MRNILRIIKISRPLYRVIAIIGLLIIAGAVLQLIVPLFSKLIVDTIVSKLNHTGNPSLQHVFVLVGMMFGLNALNTLFGSLGNRLGDHFAGELKKFLTARFYEKVLSLPQRYFDTELSGKIVNQLSRGILTIGTFMNTATNFIIPALLQSVFTLALMAYYSLPIAFFTFTLFPIYLGLTHISAKRWGQEEERKNKIDDVIRGRIQEVIGNMKLVKGYNTQQEEYATVVDNLSASNRIYARQSSMFHTVDFVRTMSLVCILTIVLGILFANTYSGALTLGTMVLLIQLIDQARRPLFSMSFILSRLQETEAGSKEFFDILSLPATEPIRETRDFVRFDRPQITFDHVSFQYETSKEVLQNVNFTITQNQKVALVGHSGAGKTTIVNLIMKLYEPTKGDIVMEKTSYKKLSYRRIRENIALVFQENELFSSTVRENVAYGKKATDEQVIDALRRAHALDFVKQLPLGIHAMVGERGIRLSGGQKQRIQIARAILKNAPILILDEATSSLDAKSEREVQDALESMMRDKMVIIIAHRFSTIQNVDRIIVIDNGSVVDDGSPHALSKRKGIYADLLHYQIEGNKKLLESFELY